MQKPLLALAAACALAAPAVAYAAPSEDKVTGGGQTLVPTEGGAGNTIAFTAQGTGGVARGQLQYNDRVAGTKVHGTVDCLRVVGERTADGGMAVFGGQLRDGTRFRVLVTDGGEGMGSSDTIMFMEDDEDRRCETEDGELDDLPELGRGNVQVHKAKG